MRDRRTRGRSKIDLGNLFDIIMLAIREENSGERNFEII